MGLDVYLQGPNASEQNSVKYPDHLFKIGYFRSSYFEIDTLNGIPLSKLILTSREEKREILQKVEFRVIDDVGYPNNLRLNTYSYFSDYSINPDFDHSILSGRVKFNKGRLVERVKLYFV